MYDAVILLKTGSMEKKGFCSEYGKGMSLCPQSMGMDGGGTGKITLSLCVNSSVARAEKNSYENLIHMI